MKKFNLYLALFSVVLDLLAIFLGLIVAYQLRAEGRQIFLWPFGQYVSFVIKFLPVWLILLASQGLYNIRSLPKGWNALGRLLIGILSGWSVLLIVLYLSRSAAALAFPRLVVVYGIFLTIIFALLGRLLLSAINKYFNRRGYGIIRSAVVGQDAEMFATRLKLPVHGRRVVGSIPQVNRENLSMLFQMKPFDELIVADQTMNEATMLELLRWAEEHGVNFTYVPSLFTVRTSNVETGTMAGTPVMFVKRTPLEGWGRIYKRIIDVVLVVPALIILSPVFLIEALLVKLSSPGPVLFSQSRVGQDGLIFYVHKFRSMYEDATNRFHRDWSANEETDPRVTPVGRVLRRTNLDELPQLWDVLVGTMSLVGPRPEQPKYVEQFAGQIPNYLRRHHVKTGLTGWAQINGLRGDTSITERVKYDLYYIENWSVWFDLRIIIATFIYMLRQLMGAA